jgi:hypothetical protein
MNRLNLSNDGSPLLFKSVIKKIQIPGTSVGDPKVRHNIRKRLCSERKKNVAGFQSHSPQKSFPKELILSQPPLEIIYRNSSTGSS